MPCGCSKSHSVPWIREGLPTVYEFGPFPDHEVVEYAGLDEELEHVL